jgi:hypothetical protein
MEAIFSSETSVDTQRTMRCYIPKDGTLHNYRCKNLKSYREFKWLGQGPVAASCEYGNEHSGFIKGKECLDQMSICEFLKRTLLCGICLSTCIAIAHPDAHVIYECHSMD